MARAEQTRWFEPYADYYQFMVSDAEANEGLPDGDTWPKSPEGWRIGVEPYGVAVATARYDYVTVLLELIPHPPLNRSFDGVSHVVETDIELPSGTLAITGCTQQPSEVEPIQIGSGRYRLRVSYAPTESRPSRSNEDEPGDYLEYRIEMWPVMKQSDVRVLKQGPSPWAG